MVIDTSALIALMYNESSAPRLVAAIERSAVRLVSDGTVIEASLVLLGRFGERGELPLDALLRALKADMIAVDADQVAIARDAARTFGRGRHQAALNFGDCFSYALALARSRSRAVSRSCSLATTFRIPTWSRWHGERGR